jgi:hypothetical protein
MAIFQSRSQRMALDVPCLHVGRAGGVVFDRLQVGLGSSVFQTLQTDFTSMFLAQIQRCGCKRDGVTLCGEA